ncbi:hypothetical protein N8771_02565 [Euryarchaeota archaeon]|nr:hypothetical protein [Euryarchaeota archaeon]
MSSKTESNIAVPRDCDTDCIVMYGGGLTSYEAAKRSIDRYGRESVEIWFADTRMEDEDLYRFNRDVEILLQHNITIFDQGLDVWEIFRRERFLGNSRIDPCSKFLKRVPLRKALEEQYPNWACVSCKEPWSKNDELIEIIEIDKSIIKIPICRNCLECDEKYSNRIRKLREIIETGGNDSVKSRLASRFIDGRVERCSVTGRFVRVVLGMDIIEDCDRLHRAKSYWRPFVNWFPLAEKPFKDKTKIIEDIRKLGVQEPRLYGAGFAHNNCGGFCVKAGKGQMVHLYNTLPERYLYHEQKELEFQEFIGSDVTILGETRNGVRRNLTLRDLRLRAEAGESFRFDEGTACACLNPSSPDVDGIAW